MLNKLFSKIVKFLILIFSGFRRNQKIISDLIVWLNIQQGRNAPVTNEMEVHYVKEFLNVNDDNVILDVGAHKGNYTEEVLKHLPNSKLFLFEPLKSNFEYLCEKFKNLENVKIYNYSLSDTVGEKTIYFNTIGDSQATLTKREEPHRNKFFTKSEVVKSNKLSVFWDSELDNKMIDLLKLDIEGVEFAVLSDIAVNLNKIKIIQFEIGEANIATKIFFKDFWEILQESKFKIFRYTHFNQLIQVKNYSEYEEFFRYSNFLAVNQNFNK